MEVVKISTLSNKEATKHLQEQVDQILPPKNGFGVRYVQFFLMFLSIVIFYGQRTSLSVAIIAMTETSPPDSNIPTYLEWKNTDIILSSFFMGYILPQTIAGQLAKCFGPKWFLVVTMTLGSILHMLIPIMAAWIGSTGVIICRLLQGINQGFLFPSIHNLISKWTPSRERSTVSGFVYSGAPLGITTSMLFTGAICETSYGWPLAFYLYGALGIFMAVLFACFISNLPSKHLYISAEEKSYIENTTFVSDPSENVVTPWKCFATSLPLWAVLITSCGQCWGTFTLLTEIPSYMKNIMNFDLSWDSQLSALPYLALFLLSLIAGPLSNILITRKTSTIGFTRKIFHGVGVVCPAVALFVLGFMEETQQVCATILLIVAVGTSAFSSFSSVVNLVDLAPNHAGTTLGIINGTSNIFSILGPLSVQFYGHDKKDLKVWRIVFWVSSGVYLGCGLFFNIFSSGEIQSWNYSNKDESKTPSNQKENEIKQNVII